MSNRSMKFVTILVVMIIGIASTVGLVTYFLRNRVDRTEGWKTSAMAGEGFTVGMIFNGKPPADFKISLVEPDAGRFIARKPGVMCRLLVYIEIVDTQSENAEVAPSFLSVTIKQGSKQFAYVLLKPHSKVAGGFYYSGQVMIPEKIGGYTIDTQAEYTIYDSHGAYGTIPDMLTPYRKSLTGVKLDVRN